MRQPVPVIDERAHEEQSPVLVDCQHVILLEKCVAVSKSGEHVGYCGKLMTPDRPDNSFLLHDRKPS